MSYTGLAVVIPTRNRPDLALTAARTSLDQLPAGGRVVVSDNSSPSNRDRLSAKCEGLSDPRLDHIAPPGDLDMTAHWQWALEQTLARSDVSHVAVLTDRMVFRDGELANVSALASSHPDDVVSYNIDHIDDRVSPPMLIQYAWSGGVRRLDSGRLLKAASRGRFPPCIPRLMNCVAPRSALERVAERFGSVCGSIAPDYSFGFRCLDVLDTTLHYDKSALLAAGLERSIGSSIVRGRLSEEGADFVAALDSTMNRATPLPELNAWPNPMFQIYCDVRGESSSSRVPPLHRGRYLAALAKGVAGLEDEEARRQGREALAGAGWTGWRRWSNSARSLAEDLSYAAHPRDFLRRVLWRKRNAFRTPGSVTATLLRWLKMLPPERSGSPHLDAFEYANRNPVERVRRRGPRPVWARAPAASASMRSRSGSSG